MTLLFKRLLLLVTTLLVFGVAPSSGWAADQRVTLTITLTNIPVTSNTLVFTAPASRTITWTNVLSSISAITNTTIASSTTNLFTQMSTFSLGVPRLAMLPDTLTTNSFSIFGEVNQVIAVTSAGTAGGNWCTLTLVTNSVTPRTAVLIPFNAVSPFATNWTNVANGVVTGASTYATAAFDSNSVALRFHLNTGTNNQDVLGPKTFYQLGGTNTGLTNGWYVNGTNINVVSSNAIFLGNALRSEGVGSNSLQIGSNALAKALRTIAIGADAFATNTDAIAMGSGAIATNIEAMAVGKGTLAGNDYATALGASASAMGTAGVAVGNAANALGYIGVAVGADSVSDGGYTVAVGAEAAANGTNSTAVGRSALSSGWNSVAIGNQAVASHSNSVAIGKGSATTTNHQILLGSGDVFLVETFARLQASSITNSLHTGTNRVNGDWAWMRYDAGALANGNNVAQPFTNVYVKASGPSADFAICGIIGGRDGRELKIENATAFVMTIANESGVDVTAANRILTPTRADITVQSNGWAQVIYDSAVSRWKLFDKYP